MDYQVSRVHQLWQSSSQNPGEETSTTREMRFQTRPQMHTLVPPLTTSCDVVHELWYARSNLDKCHPPGFSNCRVAATGGCGTATTTTLPLCLSHLKSHLVPLRILVIFAAVSHQVLHRILTYTQARSLARSWCTSPEFRPERVHPRSRSHSPRTRRNLKCQSSTIHSRHIGQNHLIPPSPSPLCTSHTSHASSAIVPRPYLTGWTAR
jgi:hypothetical protein